MASVFLSYDRDDTPRAEQVARALERAGHEVWWDLHVRGGAQFSKVIEGALKAARFVVVLWSKNSIESAWVRDEAAVGRDTGRLVPVTIDGTEPPLGFRQFQTIDLSRWRGRGAPAQLRALLADLKDSTDAVKPDAPRQQPEPWRSSKWWFAAVGAVVILAAVALWRPWSPPATSASVVVAPALSDAASVALARDVAAQLGNQQPITDGLVRLLSPSDASRKKPGFKLQLSAGSDEEALIANLALVNGKTDEILWSNTVRNSSRSSPDLHEQVVFLAGRVLGCAGEGANSTLARLRPETLKLYLSACAQMADSGQTQTDTIVEELRAVVRAAPRFTGAWRKLLVAEAKSVEDAPQEDQGPSGVGALLRDIDQARRLEPGMAEATLAQAAATSPRDFIRKMQLLDAAKNVDPDNVDVLSARAMMLRNVGRVGESIEDLQRALQLDPFSPDLHASYISSLICSGQIEGARQELQKLQELWPGSASARDAQFRFDIFFGDTKRALSYSQAQGLKGMSMFLEARLDPSKVETFVSWVLNRKDYSLGRLGVIIDGLGQLHREDDLFRVMMNWPRVDDFAVLEDLWFRPPLEQFRKDPRFMEVAARSPLVRYWKATGKWPDFCFQPSTPYDCKREAAKLHS